MATRREKAIARKKAKERAEAESREANERRSKELESSVSGRDVSPNSEGACNTEIVARGQGQHSKRWEQRMERDAILRSLRNALPDDDITDVFRVQVAIAKDQTNPRQASIAAGVISKAIDKLVQDGETTAGTIINGDVTVQQAYQQFDAQEPEYREWKRKQQLQGLIGSVDVGRNGFKSKILGPASSGGTE
jgi:hypothetical protein